MGLFRVEVGLLFEFILEFVEIVCGEFLVFGEEVLEI